MRLQVVPARFHGFSLVELLVGMVIAMLATVVVMQVYEAFEGQKRTTTGGADAQTNGSIALFNLQRDVAMAGYGLPLFSTRNPALLCEPLPAIDHDSNAGTPKIGLYPVLLVDGGAGAGASDTIIINYGATQTGGVFMPIKSAIASTAVSVDNNLACKAGDIALLINGSACEMSKVTKLTGTTSIELSTTPSLVTEGIITCMGAWAEYRYEVVNNILMRNGVSNVAGIVNIQAQYGISAAANDNTIVQWVNPTGDWALTKAGDVVTTPTLANRNRIKAIRIAVVARSGQWEKEVVSTACSSLTDPNPTGVCAWEGIDLLPPGIDSPAPKVDLSSLSEWDHYRYRTFEVIIPVRNVIWSKNTLPAI